MKKFIWWAIAVSLLLAGLIFINLKWISVSTSYKVSGSSIDFPESDTAFGGLLYTPYINDSIPYYLYKKINDSIQDAKKSLTLESNINFTSGMGVGFIGVRKLNLNNRNKLLKIFVDSLDKLTTLQSILKDSAMYSAIQKRIDSLKTEFNENKQEEPTIGHSISLRNYTLEENGKFFVQNGAYYLAVVVWDSIKTGSISNNMNGHYMRKQIPIMYSENEKKIYIPVSKAAYTFTNVLLNVWGFFLLVFSILIILIIPIFILISISRGNAFTSRNIFGLKILSYSFLFITVLKISEPFILHSIFKSRIPSELQRMSFRQILNDSSTFIIISIIVFVILKAFQKGYKLQQEQDLTV